MKVWLGITYLWSRESTCSGSEGSNLRAGEGVGRSWNLRTEADDPEDQSPAGGIEQGIFVNKSLLPASDEGIINFVIGLLKGNLTI